MVYDLFYKKSEPLVPRNLVLEIDERIAADGSIIQNLNGLNDVIKKIKYLIKNENIVSIAIALINSYKNTVHENELANYLRDKVPNIPITLSSDISSQVNAIRKYSGKSEIDSAEFLKSIREKIKMVGLDESFLHRSINEGFSCTLVTEVTVEC